MPQGSRYQSPVPRISIEHLDGIARIRLSGEVDLAFRDQFQQAVEAAESYGTNALYIDLSGVGFMDSSALAVLLGAHKRGMESDRKVLVRGVRGEVWKLFLVAGAHLVFADGNSTEFPGVADGEWQPITLARGDSGG